MGNVREAVDSGTWSLPQWADQPPDPDLTGASFLLISYGDSEAEAVVQQWEAGLRRTDLDPPVLRFHASAFDRDQLADKLAEARCGVRLMIAGGQYDVLQAMATARALGLETGEITRYATAYEDLPLFCPHCQTTSRAYAEVFDWTDCTGCHRVLTIKPHYSSQRGSFLGVDTR
ncbi:hypothetical protein HGQ17_12110 [Nesterenkonia sp. MY13]|uniref:Dimethylamine monooxygenase subunit DmmA-like C-terminal domain-containing protein n=1 Tax=Nesterenkonia sedimenti TaxID=1463632 RepID=A0A7X8TL06_9MICC|nr:dimethylamine monooxygenase subunit DmmA family protein [Nesterenkonia sedimenti]NLS10722.1 hypothetical protein [Nesterenkonia sedimenti]